MFGHSSVLPKSAIYPHNTVRLFALVFGGVFSIEYVLSGGERQRIGFARLFYHSPPFAILDEATSAINPDEEGQLYERVIEQGTTVVSIAHRLELRKFHRKELKLAGDGSGGWELHKNEAKPGSRGGDDKWKLVDKK